MGERSLACWTISPFKPVRRQRRSTAHPNGWGSAQAPTETGIIQGDMGSHGSLGALFAGLEGFKSGRALLWLVWAMLVGWAGNWLDWQDWLGQLRSPTVLTVPGVTRIWWILQDWPRWFDGWLTG